MPQSLAAIYLHTVFSTKDRRPFLRDTEFRNEVHTYLAEVSRRMECPAVLVGGAEDHVHLLVRMGRTVSVADWVKETKRVSSGFASKRVAGFCWQRGYGSFSVGRAELDMVKAYIANQAEHHKNESFQDEFRRLLQAHDLLWDEAYVWD